MQDFYSAAQPAETVISFSESAEWCRDINAADTSLATALIKTCTNLFESQTNRIFVQRAITGKFSYLNMNAYELKKFIEIRRAPLISITQVRINGSVLSSSEYALKQTNDFSKILFLNTVSLDYDLPYPIEVDFLAGYGAASAVPEAVKTAIKQWVLFLYENRGDISTDAKQKMPLVTYHIMKSYRILGTFG